MPCRTDQRERDTRTHAGRVKRRVTCLIERWLREGIGERGATPTPPSVARSSGAPGEGVAVRAALLRYSASRVAMPGSACAPARCASHVSPATPTARLHRVAIPSVADSASHVVTRYRIERRQIVAMPMSACVHTYNEYTPTAIRRYMRRYGHRRVIRYATNRARPSRHATARCRCPLPPPRRARQTPSHT